MMTKRQATLKKIEARREELFAEVRKLNAEEMVVRGRKRIRCSECGKALPISSFGFRQNYWNDTSGYDSGGAIMKCALEHCDLICPKCGGRNPIFYHPQKSEIMELAERYRHSKEFFSKYLEGDKPVSRRY